MCIKDRAIIAIYSYHVVICVIHITFSHYDTEKTFTAVWQVLPNYVCTPLWLKNVKFIYMNVFVVLNVKTSRVHFQMWPNGTPIRGQIGPKEKQQTNPHTHTHTLMYAYSIYTKRGPKKNVCILTSSK